GVATADEPVTRADHRLAVYYQTQYHGDSQEYVSPVPLADNGASEVIVGAIHLNGADSQHLVTLNDHAPDDPRYDQMWTDLDTVKSKGTRVLGMVGGAAKGSFERLDNDFDTYYPLLRDTVKEYGLDGVDLDVEEDMSLPGIERVIDALRADFGPDFVITLAPVATALSGGGNLSGFNYDDLYADRGEDIDWFNTQFYCGWGSLSGTGDYDAIIDHGVVPANKVVGGTLTNPANCGSGYVDLDTLKSTIGELKAKYPDFGGISGWEYFNSLPGDTGEPWTWAAEVSAALAG
ncbi:MAG: glycosyl hydrolase family 18 protein, partial [Stackebrandtia sp.]